eukprot:10698497-Prorocentrum_lima.AAC.1
MEMGWVGRVDVGAALVVTAASCTHWGGWMWGSGPQHGDSVVGGCFGWMIAGWMLCGECGGCGAGWMHNSCHDADKMP